MFHFLLKNLGAKHSNNALSQTLRCRFMSYKTENVIGGGLEKPQGGIKEETYFSEQNNNLMLKIRDRGTKLKNENSAIGNLNQKVSDTFNQRTTIRGSSSRNKHKNCLEEAFFLNEQSECCAKLYKEVNSKGFEMKEQTETDIE